VKIYSVEREEFCLTQRHGHEELAEDLFANPLKIGRGKTNFRETNHFFPSGSSGPNGKAEGSFMDKKGTAS